LGEHATAAPYYDQQARHLSDRKEVLKQNSLALYLRSCAIEQTSSIVTKQFADEKCVYSNIEISKTRDLLN
jgi:hypothetical protein